MSEADADAEAARTAPADLVSASSVSNHPTTLQFAGGFATHAITAGSWVLGFVALFGAAAASAYGAARGRVPAKSGIVLALLVGLLAKPAGGKSEAFWRVMGMLDPVLYYHGGHGAVRTLGALGTIRPARSLFLCAPHGVLCVGYCWNICWSRVFNAGQECYFLVDNTLRSKNPLFKQICDWHGTLTGIKKSTLQGLFAAGKNIAAVPGGFVEATAMQFEHDIVIQGTTLALMLLKFALQGGYRLHPVYTFGEGTTFRTPLQTSAPYLRAKLNAYNLPAVLPVGEPSMPLFPRRDARVVTVVGEPIQLPTVPDPSREEVVHWHCVYLSALRRLFEREKAAAGFPDAVLELTDLSAPARL